MQIKEQVCVTDPGTKREHNEDALLTMAPLSLFGVADGMGGGEGNGRAAAETALATIAAEEDAFTLHRDQITQERSTTHRLALGKFLDQLFNQISRTIQSDAEEANHTKHTSALLLAMMVRNFAYIAHVGNCQAYLLRDGHLRRLNEDHSLARYRYRRGRLSHEEFKKSPARHVLYQSLGAGMEIDVDLAEVRLNHGDVLLLCSDGLFRALDESAVRDAINPGDLNASSKRLLAQTKEHGASDNVSFALLSFASDEQDESIDVITDVMSNVFLFQNMSDAERMVIAPYLEEAVYDKGDTIINKGDLGDCFYVMVSGHARITRDSAFLTDVYPGDHFGELALTRPIQRSATVQALAPSQLFSLSHQRFQDLLQHKPELGARMALLLLDTVGARLRDLTDRLSLIERAVRGDIR